MRWRLVRTLFFSLCCCSLFAKHSENDTGNQYMSGKSHDMFKVFFTPISFNKKSISSFLCNSYNHPLYAREFLAFNYSHALTLFSFTPSVQQPRTYIRQIARLFNKRVRETYVNAYRTSEFLRDLPGLVGPFFPNKRAARREATKKVRACVYDFLKNNFDQLKHDPDTSIDKLSGTILDVLGYEGGKKMGDCSVKEAQYSISDLCSALIDRLAWSYIDQADVWHSVKQLASELEECSEHNIIPEDTLDDLIWALLYRFKYFLELDGFRLNKEVYDEMRKDLDEEDHILWSLPESEELVTTKKMYLLDILKQSISRTLAINAGLVTDYVTLT